MRRAGYEAVLVLSGHIHPAFEVDVQLEGALLTRVLSVVPLRYVDWELKRRDGLDALLQEWHADGRTTYDVDL